MSKDFNEPVHCRVKWYNTAKGYGFVNSLEGNDDWFLHATTLQKIGSPMIGEGGELICMIGEGPKGMCVKQVVDVLSQGNLPPGKQASAAAGTVQEVTGIVKWYDPEKEYGFVSPEDGMKDIFVHRTCLEKHGLDVLGEGQKLKLLCKMVAKGREAHEIVSFL